jgi:RNA polymerase sigma factor for flagellar operon FliA
MRATISGQAGLAVIHDDSTVLLYSIDDPDTPQPVAAGQMAALFEGATDAFSVNVVDHDEAVSMLSIAWKRDRLLQMILILLRRDAEIEIRRMAADAAEQLMTCGEALHFARNRLYSRPLFEDADLVGAISISDIGSDRHMVAVLTQLRDHQDAIGEIAHAWQSLASVLMDRERVARLRRVLEEHDIWYRLAAIADPRELDATIANVLGLGGLAAIPDVDEALRHLAAARREALRSKTVEHRQKIVAHRDREAENLFLDNIETIDRIVGFICSSNRLNRTESEEFASEVKLSLISYDYDIIRKFEGRSTFSTYIVTVIRRLFYQKRIKEWGKWRPSAEAKRIGQKAIILERLLTRDGLSFSEACQCLTTGVDPDFTVAEVERIYARLPPRQPRPVFVSKEKASEALSGEASAEDGVLSRERERIGRLAAVVLDAEMTKLDAEDRLILKMRFWHARRHQEIAATLHMDQKKVYKRIDKLLAALRRELERAGIRREDFDDLTHQSLPEIPLVFFPSTGDHDTGSIDVLAGGSRLVESLLEKWG